MEPDEVAHYVISIISTILILLNWGGGTNPIKWGVVKIFQRGCYLDLCLSSQDASTL